MRSVKRIIPCLDVRDGRVVKGQQFTDIQDVSDPAELAAFYCREGADELVFYDITASVEGRKLFTDVLERAVREISVPLTVGGGISTLEDFDRVLTRGADKVSINSGALQNPGLVADAARRYGSGRVILSMDVKTVGGQFLVFSRGGQENTGMDAVEWARRGAANGAGELVINSIDTDGVKGGFDLELLAAITGAVEIPVIASGGAGRMEDFLTLFQTVPQVDAGLAASVFHFREVAIPTLKDYLRANGIPVAAPMQEVKQ